MGVYFIAAGATSKNRNKTLDKAHKVEDILEYLTAEEKNGFRKAFPKNEDVFLWGANKGKSYNELVNVKSGEYVVDVKNKKVMQVFVFCFFIATTDTRLQEFLGWDREKATEDRRPYKYVYFLKSPLSTLRTEKEYFQHAFVLEGNQNWLVGQRYFNDQKINEALKRTSRGSVEEFLGISSNAPEVAKTSSNASGDKKTSFALPTWLKEKIVGRKKESVVKESVVKGPVVESPHWLKSLTSQIITLKNDSGHLERDHEDIVASLFELLGYKRTSDIKFRRGNIDIRILKDNISMITIEVKASWGLSKDDSKALKQAFNYALQEGTPYVILTNGEVYYLYDRRKGLSYKEHFVAEINLTKMTAEKEKILESLKKENIA